jgi:tape measure domain-containing protein
MTAIRVELELADGSFTSRMIHAGETVERFNDNILRSNPALARQMAAARGAGQAMGVFAGQTNLAFTAVSRLHDSSRGFLSTLRDVTVVVGVAGLALNNIRAITTGWAGDIIKVNADMENLRQRMVSLSTASDPLKDAAENVAFLRQEAKTAPFALAAISESFTRMKAAGIDPTTGSLRAFEDAVAAAGGGDEKLNRVSLAISQMAGKGVIQMEELRQQLGEALPRATELMARSMGVTYGELVKAIATGTVSAIPALRALDGELARTFGGAAERQMQTFQGQIALMKSRWQDLALTIGETGYFDAVKKQLRDLNAFLGSERASAYAKSIGDGLTSVVLKLRETLDTFISFRNEIALTAQVAAVAFIGTRAIAGITAMQAAVAGARAQFATLRAEMALSTAFAAASAGALNTAGAAQTLGASMTFASRSASVLWIALRSFAPIIAVAAVAVVGLGSAFGVFTNKAQDALEEIDKFGAKSREQIEIARAYVEAEEKRIATMERYATAVKIARDLAAGARPRTSLFNGTSTRDALAEEAKAEEAFEQRKKQATENRRRLDQRAAEFERASAKEITQEMLGEVQTRIQDQKRTYDEEKKSIIKSHEEKRKLLIDAGKDTSEQDAAFRDALQKANVAYYDNEIKLLEEFVEKQTFVLSMASGKRKDGIQEVVDDVNSRLVSLMELRQQAATTPLGIQTTPKETDYEALAKKALDLQNRLKASIADTTAELNGASGEAAKLAYQIDQAQKFGDPANAKIRLLRDGIIEAATEAERLQDILTGKKEFENDLLRLEIQQRQELARIKAGGNLSEVDELKLKLANGGYGSFNGSTNPLVQTTKALGSMLETVRNFAQQASEALAKGIFGTSMVSSAKTLLDTVRQIADNFARISNTTFDAGPFAGLAASAGAAFAPVGNAAMRVGAMFGMPTGGYKTAVDTNGANTGGLSTSAQDMMAKIIASGVVKNLDVISGYRSQSYNDSVGGAKGSQHVHGNAIDIDISKLTDSEKAALLQAAVAAGAKGIGIYNGGSSMHLDTRAGPAATWGALGDKYAGHAPGLHPAWAQAPLQALFSGRSNALTAPATAPNTGVSRLPNPAGINPAYATKLDQLAENERVIALAKGDQALADGFARITREIREANTEADGFGKRVAETRKLIESGAFGTDTNPDSERYKKLIELATQWQNAEKKVADQKKATTEATSAADQFERSQREIGERLRTANLQLANPLTDKDPAARARLVTQMDEYIAKMKEAYGVDSANYKKALEDKATMVRQYDNVLATEKAAEATKEANTIQRGLLTESQSREKAIQDEITRQREYIAAFQGTAEEKARIEQAFNAKLAAMRQAAAAADPFARQLREWGDLQTQMSTTAASWLDSTSDALAGFVTGAETDFKALVDSMVRDMARLAIRFAMSQAFAPFMGGKAGAPGAAAGTAKGGGAAKAGGGGMKAMFGRAHTGGIIGASRLAGGMVNPMAFAGAPRFHTGGIIRGLGIGPGEVPIIAKRGEGVFTPEQMKALGNGGGGNAMTIQNNVTVNANGGSPEQNDDLAKKVAASMEATTRQIVVSEMGKQMRPGGMIRR